MALIPEKEIKIIERQAMGYIDDVLSGKILACRFVKLACQRHLNDLKYAHERGLIFNRERAAHATQYFSYLKLWKGKGNKGQEFILSPHYYFINWTLMGWYRKQTGFRRFTKAYIEKGRKTAKSAYAGGLGSYFFVADGEHGAEIYCCAVGKEQAYIVWENIRNLTKTSGFAKKITYLTHAMMIKETNSKCEYLASKTDSMDGLDIHFASLDELHAHPKRLVYDVIVDACAAKDQPLILIITTAGFNQTSVCYETRDYIAKILKDVNIPDGFKDDSFFGIIYTLDMQKDWPELISKKEKELKPDSVVEDDWQNEDVWIKSVPTLKGISATGIKYGLDKNNNTIPGYMTKLEDIRDACRIAIQMPSAQNNFLTKRLNIWTQQENRWLSLDLWDKNNIRPVKEENLLGKWAVGGIDLSSVSDLTIWCMLFPDETDKNLLDILIRVWCPKARLYDTRNRYREQYQSWEKQGYLLTTDGDAIDYGFIRQKIVEDNLKFRISSISVDRQFQGYEFSQELNKEFGATKDNDKVIACGMGFQSMAGPCNELERRLLTFKLNHGGNPVLRFMADNVCVDTDPKGNHCPNKKTSQGKIDGIIGILLGLDRLLRREQPIESVYKTRGILML